MFAPVPTLDDKDEECSKFNPIVWLYCPAEKLPILDNINIISGWLFPAGYAGARLLQ